MGHVSSLTAWISQVSWLGFCLFITDLGFFFFCFNRDFPAEKKLSIRTVLIICLFHFVIQPLYSVVFVSKFMPFRSFNLLSDRYSFHFKIWVIFGELIFGWFTLYFSTPPPPPITYLFQSRFGTSTPTLTVTVLHTPWWDTRWALHLLYLIVEMKCDFFQHDFEKNLLRSAWSWDGNQVSCDVVTEFFFFSHKNVSLITSPLDCLRFSWPQRFGVECQKFSSHVQASWVCGFRIFLKERNLVTARDWYLTF